MSTRIKKFSRLRFADLLEVGGVQFWDMVDFPVIQPQPDDIQHMVLGSDRLDTLANKYYKNPVLKFVIMLANDMELEPSDLHEGVIIRIPSPRYVLQELFEK